METNMSVYLYLTFYFLIFLFIFQGLFPQHCVYISDEPIDAYSGLSLSFANKVVTVVTTLRQSVPIHFAGTAV